MSVSRKKTTLPVALAALFVLAVLAVTAPADLFAQGGPGTQPPAQPPAARPTDPNLIHGARFFDDAIRYVSRGQTAMPRVRDFYTKLDAKIELDSGKQEGQMRVWFQAPTRYRQELTTNGATTTKILSDNMGWIRTPNGRVQNLALSPDGQRTIKQLKEDRDRISDLTQFLTLEALKGPGVTFKFERYTKGTGTYEGNWIMLTRRAPGRTNIVFWLAYERDAQNQVRATYPGIVRVEGDPRQGYPTEDYILKEWDSPLSQQQRTFRYPRRIEAYSLLKDRSGQAAPTRFLFAIVDDIKINAGVDPSRFQQPGAGGPR